MLNKFLQSYLRFLARRYLKKVKPKIIAVTGSAGKTSTKEAIFEVLKAGFGHQVRRSEGNLNTVYGIPLAILGFKKPPVPLDRPFSPWLWIPVIFVAPFKIFSNRKTKYLILEMAADKPGDIQFTTSYIRPDIAVITNLGPAHLEIFGTIEKIIAEKTGLLKALSLDGWAILNYDDEKLRKLNLGFPNLKTFAINENVDITAKNITTEIVDYKPLTKFQVISGKNKYLAESSTLGRVSNIYSNLAAIAVSEILGEKNDEIIQGLKNIKPEKHRMEIFQGKAGNIIIDDCYNANPLSMKAALDTLKILPAGRKIAVLGDMLELGEISPKAHRLIGDYSKEIADLTIAIGDLAKDYFADKSFAAKKEAINFLLSEIQEGDMLLIKASRGMRFEEIVEALKN